MTLLDTLDELIAVYKNAPGRHDQRTHAPTVSVRGEHTTPIGRLPVAAGEYALVIESDNLAGAIKGAMEDAGMSGDWRVAASELEDKGYRFLNKMVRIMRCHLVKIPI